MNTIIERITEAIKDILIGLIKSCLDNMFTSVNEQVGTIAGQVGQTPQGWNAGIFNLIQNISQTVIVPIAGLIITFVLCYELITMVTQKNNFHEFETYNIFLWIFKAYVAIYLVTNTFNITMAVFDVGQHVVNNAAGVISGNTAVDASEAVARIVDALEDMELGDLFLLSMETLLISITMRILSIIITVILYGRMIEIYLYTSIAPIPFLSLIHICEACTRLAQSIPGEIAVIRLVPARNDWNDVLRQQGDIPSRKFIAETITLRELPTRCV